MSDAKAAAINIRAAVKNLNELVIDAYKDHEIITTYEVMKGENRIAVIFPTVAQEV